jgi:glycosyltransferase involved in cell wall biosynthesis
MTADTFAALIPLYNKERYVARAITSVLAQARPVDEIIIVDDPSTDGSAARITAFPYPRLQLLRRTDPKQRGLPRLAISELDLPQHWIALLDADDRWHEDYIEEIEKLLPPWRRQGDVGGSSTSKYCNTPAQSSAGARIFRSYRGVFLFGRSAAFLD